LYWPAIQQVRAVLVQAGLLSIAGSKLEAPSIRARLARQGDYYLTPLSQIGEHGDSMTERSSMVAQTVMHTDQG
jgi:hypothetical protein